MRYKRSERIVFMTQYLMNHPNQLIPLTFVKNLNKRSLQLVKMFKLLRILSKRKLGTVITTAGASGGYKPMMSKEEASKLLKKLLNYSKKKNDYYRWISFLIRFSW